MSDIEEFYNNNKTVLMLWSFDKSLDNTIFPDSLEQIFFGNIFNQPIDNIKFPHNLKIIVFSSKFNKPLNNVKFPDSLESIDFGDDFNFPIDGIAFPPTLRIIILGTEYSKPITNLPIFLKEIRITNFYQLKNVKLPLDCVIYNHITDVIVKMDDY